MSPRSNPGISGVTFDIGTDRLVGIIYLASGHEPKPTAMLLHGCPGLEQNGDLAVDLRDHGWNALIFHYRGCWGSQGRYNLRTVTADVLAAVDYLATAPFPAVDPSRLAVVGQSYGGWAGIQAAAVDDRLRAVVAIGAPATLEGLRRSSDEDLERLGTRFLNTTPADLRQQLAEITDRPGPLEFISAISPRPVLIVHAADDELVPAAEGRALYEQAGPPRRYVELSGANHAFSLKRGELRELVVGWLAETELAETRLAET
jgi:uncharacterized protein